MRSFEYGFLKETEYPNVVLKLLCDIEKKKNDLFYFEREYASVLDKMKDIAKDDSALSSLALDGIYTSDRDIEQLKQTKILEFAGDGEILGYTDAQEYVLENPEYTGDTVKKLHSEIFEYTYKAKGEYKKVDNVLLERLQNGEKRVVFLPVPYPETDLSVFMASRSFNETLKENEIHPLILCACALLDFICIMPFKEGNGRVSRLVANLLLLKSGYDINRYVSIDDIIYDSYDSYLKAWADSRRDWLENGNDYMPFIIYFLSVISKAYEKVSFRFKLTGYSKMSKAERIRHLLLDTGDEYSKEDIYRIWPDMVYNTIELELSKMIKEGLIRKTGTTKDAKYIRI